ncbi:MAG TPA: sugar transferase [Tepidisphaeraceae bacterium]|nr:sugar transferase [Tepidisphaeraceae bacterium]
MVNVSQEDFTMLYQQCPVDVERQGVGDLQPGMEGPLHRWYVPCKVAVEWGVSLMLLVCIWPVIVGLGILVKLTSRGPALYSQIRLGKHGRTFRMYKIRTMVDRCEDGTGPVWCRPNDSRVTAVGRVLRDTHLDELPQLWNVLRGDMCLIGPRPERPELVDKIEQVIPGYRSRLLVRPGVTGLAQMQRPPDTDLNDVRCKLAYDLYYVRHVNVWLDVRIAISTALNTVGVGFHVLGKLLVNSYRQAVENDPRNALPMREQAPVGRM